MDEIQFKRAELEDKEIISRYFTLYTSRSCERTFANVYRSEERRVGKECT